MLLERGDDRVDSVSDCERGGVVPDGVELLSLEEGGHGVELVLFLGGRAWVSLSLLWPI